MDLREWASRSARRGRLSDSSLVSGKVIGDSERDKFLSVWADKVVLAGWSRLKKKNKLNRL